MWVGGSVGVCAYAYAFLRMCRYNVPICSTEPSAPGANRVDGSKGGSGVVLVVDSGNNAVLLLFFVRVGLVFPRTPVRTR